MNVVYFTGNVGRDAEVRNAGNDKVCSFSVAVKQGFGRDAKTEWYRVSVWGKRGESLAQHIVKGSKVAVAGELVIGEYQGKPQYEVRAYEVDPFCGGKEASQDAPREQQQSRQQPAYDPDDGDGIPF